MAEERADAYDTAAGLLRNLGFSAHVDPAFKPPGAARPVTALVTDAPPVVVGYAVAMVAEDPEAHLPVTCAKAGRAAPGKAGDPQFAWWADK